MLICTVKSFWDSTNTVIRFFTWFYSIHDIHHVSKAWYFTAWFYEKKIVGDKTRDGTDPKNGCVTPFYRIPRNKDRKRRWLTFLCRKTLPNIEYMYVCGEHFVTGKYIIYHKKVFHFPLLLENLQHNLYRLRINYSETVYFVVRLVYHLYV